MGCPTGQPHRMDGEQLDNGLGATEFGVFTFGGKWPTGVDSVSLPTEQRYSDGTAVRWDEEALDAASESNIRHRR